ncbi:MAG TPA: 4Fe-4S dicluster domain-containing protein [Thermodesulfobacteriota bacterium]|nr:4Fe-4S dicluster domain-containing protein [Thermodesulfobacteriota bacterium]
MKSIFVEVEKCTGCKSCEIACALNRSSLSRRLPDAIDEKPSPLARVRVEPAGEAAGFPVQCRHCTDAPCLDACPAAALYRDPEGLVLLKDDRCVGCWMCVMVCPFGAPQPFRNFPKIMKCDRCAGRDEVSCVESCPTGALTLVDSEEIAKRKRMGLKSRIGLDFARSVNDKTE